MADTKSRDEVLREWVDEYVALRDSLEIPVAWRSREKGSSTWQVHANDPTDAISKYKVGGLKGHEIEPLFTLPRARLEAELIANGERFLDAMDATK